MNERPDAEARHPAETQSDAKSQRHAAPAEDDGARRPADARRDAEAWREAAQWQLVHEALRELPLRRAPGTLEARVLGELQRRAALPWWRHGFGHWPMAARAVLLAMSGGLAVLALLSGTWPPDPLRMLNAAGMPILLPTHQAETLMSVAAGLATLPSQIISPAWLYATLAAGAVLYAALFALGVVAYRTLYLEPQPAGDPS